MSSINLSSLISEFPEERDAVERLLRWLQQASARQQFTEDEVISPEWTVQRLFDVAHPRSQRSLARILHRLVEKGVLRQIVRVESVTKGGLGDYDSLDEIPPTLFDEFLGYEVDVSMSQVRTIYSLRSSVQV